MQSTVQSHLALMHRQDRNNANNIFGGHLLRLAAELAYSTALLHAGRHCEAIALGDVTFKQPVPIGCVLEFRAKVQLWAPSVVTQDLGAAVRQPIAKHSCAFDARRYRMALGERGSLLVGVSAYSNDCSVYRSLCLPTLCGDNIAVC